jgi:ABC-type multidrug transport system fused ATPase/permease subunit
MNFKIKKQTILYLALLTLCLGLMQVLTPLFLRTLIDGIIPSKDGMAIAHVLIIIGINELLLVLGNSQLNRELDALEKTKIHELRKWMIEEAGKIKSKLINPEAFYQSWSNDGRRLVYKKVKNPWYRIKDFVILTLLSFICLNISYLAGILIIIISVITFSIVIHYVDRRGMGSKKLYSLTDQEKKLFDDYLSPDQSIQTRIAKMTPLLAIAQEINDLQYEMSQERTAYQDINNGIRFIMMFTILGIGGYLYASDKLSMGSLWALLITMYRITPPIQSLIRWILQSSQDENLEERILDNMKTKDVFKKPSYYNRMVKIIETVLHAPTVKIVSVHSEINEAELLDALELWKSYYSKKDQIVISSDWPKQIQPGVIYFILASPQTPFPQNCLVFTKQTNLPPMNEAVPEILTLNP